MAFCSGIELSKINNDDGTLSMTISPRHWLLCASILSAGSVPHLACAAGSLVSSGEKGQVTERSHASELGSHHAKPKKRTKSTHGNNAFRGISARRSEEIMVTGSMLSKSRNSDANPVQTISSKQLTQTGLTNLGDILQRMPSIGSSGTGNSDTNGGGGASCIDLRNLGQQRVLVMIDGKRVAMDALSNCVDTNTLPIQLIDNIEILKDGGSELYGADAVSGVVNIKLRHNLNTGGVTIRGGITGRGDGKTGMLSAYKGWNFDHERGNITVGATYNTTEGLMQRSRSWANPVQIGTSGKRFGSGYSSQPLWQDNNGNTLGSTPSRYQFGQDSMLTNSVNTGTLYGDAHYDFNRHATLYSNVLYSHRDSLSQLAPMPFYGSIPPSTLPSNLTVPGNYPGNPFGQDATMASRRFTEFGPRRFENSSDTYTVKSGLKGEIIDHWMYDASFTYGWNQNLEHDLNIGSYTNLLNGYGLQQVQRGNANSALAYNPSLCPSSGCASPFHPLSGKAAAYANATTNTHSYYQLRDWNLRIHNSRVVTMPWEHGGALGIALGMEHRGEHLSSTPDPLISSGQSMTNSVQYTGGGFNVTEGYAETSFNLLHNAFLAKDLTVDAQGRVSAYNTFGTTKNWKASINWMPTRDVRFRGTIGTSYRQPSVYELYQGQNLSYNQANDPCDMGAVGTYGAQSAVVASRCAQQKINTKTFTAQGSGQVPTLGGGNNKLNPETSRTYTFGAVFTPRWIPRLSLSAEFWHTTVSNTVGSLPTQYILDQCYTAGKECGLIQRNGVGQLQQVTANNMNIGGLRTSGVDLDLNYSLPLTPDDVVTVENNIQQLVSYQQQYTPGGQWYNYYGRLLYQNGQGMPTFRDYATATWRHKNFSITYMMQYMGGMTWNNSTRDLTSADGPRHSTPGMFEHDITLNYRWKKWNFQGGITNIANKRPPFVADGGQNSLGSLYSNFYAGRSFYLQAGLAF